MDHIFNGTFGVERKFLNWVPEGTPARLSGCFYTHTWLPSQAGDGVFSTNDNGMIKLVDLKTNATTDLLKYSDVRDVSYLITKCH